MRLSAVTVSVSGSVNGKSLADILTEVASYRANSVKSSETGAEFGLVATIFRTASPLPSLLTASSAKW